MDHALQLKDVNVVISGNTILKDISLSIEKGETAAIIGPNGAGKTTLLKVMLGILQPTSGTVKLSSRNIGYVPQRLDFDRDIPLTVKDFLIMVSGCDAHLFSKLQGHHHLNVKRSLRLVHGEKLLKRTLGTLSGGELQRVLIAQAIINDPDILFLDEPASGIDIGGEQTLYQLIHNLQQEKKMTIVLVSHDLHMIYQYTDHIFAINQKLYRQGKPSEVKFDEEVKGLFGEFVTHYHH